MSKKMHLSERRFADFLDSQGLDWEYEPKRFVLEDTTYRPDFFIPSQDIYYEVVGTKQAYFGIRTKLQEMAILHPNIILRIVKPDGSPHLNQKQKKKQTVLRRKSEFKKKQAEKLKKSRELAESKTESNQNGESNVNAISFRTLTVDRTSPTSAEPRRFYPRVRLQGRWLKDAGFEIGDTVKVTAKDEKVIVEKVALGEAG